MKFLYSDTKDFIDPNYDFIDDSSAPGRKISDDKYAHEVMDTEPYDGLLVAMSGLVRANNGTESKTKYKSSETQEVLREGIRKFLRYDGENFKNKIIMGDCGSFAYADQPKPAFEPWEVADFYLTAGFSHGCHPDHIIFDFDKTNPSAKKINNRAVERYEITLSNAEQFLRLTQNESPMFEPVGVVQGWSPASMAQAARSLEKMGFKYLAIGGLVPLSNDDIHSILQAVRYSIDKSTKIHLLGFAKADHIQDFIKYDINSFDSTSPLIKAFKDSRKNYFLPKGDGTLEYFTAIRIPQAWENKKLLAATKSGLLNGYELLRKEKNALGSLRDYDIGKTSLDTALNNILEYQKSLTIASESDQLKRDKKAESISKSLHITLEAMPWKQCECSICRSAGVEVIIFRASNRNKRRGFHNLGVYLQHVKNLRG
jgi:hypothetical protein